MEENLLNNMRGLMEELSVPDWLIEETIEKLEVRVQTMGESDLYNYLKGLGETEKMELPAEFEQISWLKSVHEHHSEWITQEAEHYVKITYESFDSHIGKCPLSIQGTNKAIQETYLAVGATLLNIFAQLDLVKPSSIKVEKKRGFFSKLFGL